MPKEFYTERDIEDMFKRGILSLQVNEDVVLTELAFEKANRLGMKLLREHPVEPPAAPMRPYISELRKTVSAPTSSASDMEVDLSSRIRLAVTARLGAEVDPALLDVIIQRVLKNTGAK